MSDNDFRLLMQVQQHIGMNRPEITECILWPMTITTTETSSTVRGNMATGTGILIDFTAIVTENDVVLVEQVESGGL